MKKLFFLFLLLFTGTLFAQTATTAIASVVTPDVTSGALTFLTAHLGTWFSTLLVILGSIVVIGTFIDEILPDHGATVAKILAIPILGTILNALIKFSPLNYDINQTKTTPTIPTDTTTKTS